MPLTWSIAAAPHAQSSFVVDLLVVLAAAALVSMVLRRLRLATIPGYLIAGALIGPGLIGLVGESENIDQIKQLAVVLLMFTIGLHLDLSSVSRGLVHILAVGAISTISVVLLSWPVGWVLGASAPGALAIAMAMSMSSTAVVLRLLAQKRETHRMHGRLCVGISIVQDLLSLAMLAALPLLAKWAGMVPAAADDGGGVSAAITKGLVALGSIGVLIAFGLWILPRLLMEAAREASGESTLVLSAAVALGAAVLTGFVGFSPELGAFMAGFLLAATPFRYQLAGQLSPLRDLFMAVFFTAVGLKLNPATAAAAWPAIVCGLPALIIIKSVVIGLCTWGAGASAPVAGRTGLSLAQAGEFSIVILGLAAAQSVISGPEQTVAITLVVLSLMVTPNLYDLGQRMQSWLARFRPVSWTGDALKELPEGHEVDPGAAGAAGPGPALTAGAPEARPARGNHVIVAGYGVIGRAVADHLEVSGVPYTIVELNSRTVETQRGIGRTVVFGDIGNPEVLERAGIQTCDAVFLTIPDDDATTRACQSIRSLAPHVYIAARTAYLSTAFAASAAGADDVTIAEVATAEAMAKRIVARLKTRHAPKRT